MKIVKEEVFEPREKILSAQEKIEKEKRIIIKEAIGDEE